MTRTVNRQHTTRFWTALTLLALVGSPLLSDRVVAQDDEVPGAPHLLPENTYLYARLDNADDLRDDLANSSIGRMLNDPKLKPFAGDLYGTMRDLFDQISDEVGVSLDELLSIPSGQVSLALIPGRMPDPESNPRAEANESESADQEDDSDAAIRRRLARRRRQENGFAGVFIIDAGSNVDKLQSIIDRLERRATENDRYVRIDKAIGKTEVVRLLPPRQGPPEIEYFERDGVIVFGIGHRTAQDVLAHWTDESEDPTLADSSNFAAIMSRCVGAESTRPQLTFYFDPYHLAERIVMRSGSMTVGVVWPMIENLGLARIRGIGGSSFRAGEVFDGISHVHILIDPPRDGLLGVLRPETGDTTPPNWVPADVTGYTTVYWDMEQTYDNVGKILDNFQGEDSLKRFVEEPMKKSVGVSMREDLLANLTGRFVRSIWMERPVRLNSQSSINALELNDPVAAKSVIAKLRERDPNMSTVETIAGKVVYFMRQRNRGNFPEGLRRPEPCLVILGDWVILSDSRKFMERVIRANSGAVDRLVNVPDYDLVASELGGKLDGEKPFFLSYMDSSEFIRQLYDLAKANESRQFLRRAGEDNQAARRMADLMQRHQLPSFEEFEKYFAPSGTFGYDEPTGIHFGIFTLRPEE